MFFAQDGEDGAAGPPGVSGTGGGVTSPFNVTPDTHLALPTGVGLGPNDEFETGSSIDTAGTRYAGATPWTAFNAVTGTTTNVDSGSLVLTAANVTLSNNGYSQPIVGATWEYTCRLAITMQSAAAYGMLLATAAGASGAILQIVVYSGTTAYAQRYNSATSFNSNMANTAVSAQFNYLRVGYDGTNLNLYVSTTGVGSTFVLLYSETPAAFLGSVPTLVAVSGNINGGNAASQGVFDWFRRTA
jgi:hypothetical protein